MSRAKSTSLDVLISLAITLVMLSIVNFLLVYFSPDLFKQSHFPRALLNHVDRCYQTFYPDAHGDTFKNWVAVLGDSYGAGSGDEFLDGKPDYGIFHKLRARTHKNYLIFARSGFGSINEVRELKLCMRMINDSWLLPHIEKPAEVLFLFYEGNDLNDNIKHLESNKKHEPVAQFVHDEIFSGEYPWSRRIRLEFPLYGLLWGALSDFAGGLRDGAGAVAHRQGGAGRSRMPAETSGPATSQGASDDAGRGHQNYVIVGHRVHLVPLNPQSAAAELTGDLTVGLQVFYDSVLALREYLPGTPITIVYLPSVVTPYSWQDPVQVEAYHTDKPVFTNARDNEDHSRRIRQSIGDFAIRNDFGFVDTTAQLQSAARTELVHGPRDWRHFNALGYRIVADTLAGAPPTLESTPSR